MDFYNIKKWLNYKYSTNKYSKRLYIVEDIYNYLEQMLKDYDYEIEDEKKFYIELINYILKYSYLDKKINIKIKLKSNKIKNYNENIDYSFIDELFNNLENYIQTNNIQISNKYNDNKINDFSNFVINIIPLNEIEEEHSDSEFIILIRISYYN